MNVLTAQQIRAWDDYTMQHEPIASINLMERAAQKCADWIIHHAKAEKFIVICGKGNNGGDGLAISRMLFQKGFPVSVFISENKRDGTGDFNANLQRLQALKVNVSIITSETDLPVIDKKALVIDALFGTGIKGQPEGIDALLIGYMNDSGAPIISIDMPSGMIPDASSRNNKVVKAQHTLTFQCYKTALLVSENAAYFGKVHVLDISLHPSYLQSLQQDQHLIDLSAVQRIFRPRHDFAHKGTYGHAMILGGSYGKIGAVVLATAACLRTGAGLVTAYVPQCGYTILQSTVPEAMTITDNEDKWITQPPSELPQCNALGIGPGMGTEVATQKVVSFIIRRYKKPLVIDADGLNCISQQPDMLSQLCRTTILTPHPKEFDRLFGESEDGFHRLEKARQQALALKVIVILKGHHTLVALPDGNCYFNTTGNAGMAKGGSGDVLTGMLTALLAQGYPPSDAAILGVYLHGLAGDLAAARHSREAMIASDLIAHLSGAFLLVNPESDDCNRNSGIKYE